MLNRRHHPRPVVAVTAGLAALTLAAACAGPSAGPAPAGSSPPTTRQQQATTAPSSTEPPAPSDEAQCIEAEGNAPWFATIAAFEVHDSERTHRYGCATFPGSMTGPNQVSTTPSAEQYVTPYNIVDRGPDELYVYGGAFGDNPAASGAFVSRLEPGTFEEVWRRVLIDTNATGEWNYPGVLSVMADGSLVVIYGYRIAELDPETGDVVATTTLPTGGSAPGDTSYNGFDALDDGTIIAKSVNRQAGCTEQGFSAFLKCPDPTAVPPSVLVAIDPSTLQVLAQTTLPEMSGGRITTTTHDGSPAIYVPGATNLYRYTYTDGQLLADPTWGPVPYLLDGQTPASAMAVLGDWVVAMTNGGKPTPTPLSVVAVDQRDATRVANLQPFPDSTASFIPSMVSVDPENDRVYVMDAGAQQVAGVDLRDGQLSVAWTADQTTLSFTTLVGPAEQRVLIGTDIPITSFQELSTYTTEAVVWRDAATGTELARSDQLPRMSPVLVTPGYGGVQYFLAADGHVVGLDVEPAPTTSTPTT